MCSVSHRSDDAGIHNGYYDLLKALSHQAKQDDIKRLPELITGQPQIGVTRTKTLHLKDAEV